MVAPGSSLCKGVCWLHVSQAAIPQLIVICSYHALQNAEDLQNMLKCMASNGFLSNEADMKILPQDPYEYLQTAELNQRSVGFIPAGTKVCLPVAKVPSCPYCPLIACTDAGCP